MNRLRSFQVGPWAAYLARRLGVMGWLGLASLVGALALWWLLVQPAQQRQAALEQRLRSVQAQMQQAAAGDAAREKTPTEQLLEFYARFQPRTQVPVKLEALQALAQKNKIELETGDYSYVRMDGQRLDQLRISLPVRGTYTQIRQYAEQVLADNPDMALQSLSLRREKLAQDVVDARLVLVLFVDQARVQP